MPNANSISRPESVAFCFATYRNGARTQEGVGVLARSIEEAAAQVSKESQDRVLVPTRTCVLTGRERDVLRALLHRVRDIDPSGDVELAVISAAARKLLCEVAL